MSEKELMEEAIEIRHKMEEDLFTFKTYLKYYTEYREEKRNNEK